MSDENGLVYMRARYYSPTFKRFINADVVAGSITNAITLNRYAYANGNPVSNVDPFGLSPERGSQGEAISTDIVVIDEPMHGKAENATDQSVSNDSYLKAQEVMNYLIEKYGGYNLIISKDFFLGAAAIFGAKGYYSIVTDGVDSMTDFGLTLTQGACFGVTGGISTTVYFGYESLNDYSNATIFSKTVNLGIEITLMYEYSSNGDEKIVGFVLPSAFAGDELLGATKYYSDTLMIPDISFKGVFGIYANSSDMIKDY